jgi:hypothetical protein
MKFTILAALAATALSATSASAAAPIFSETFDNKDSGFRFTGNVTLADATTYVACCNTIGTGSGNFAAFGGGNLPSGSLAAIFTTVVGQLYSVGFNIGAVGQNSDTLIFSTGATTDTLATFNGFADGAPVDVFTAFADNNLDTTFKADSFTFTATSELTALLVQGGGANNADALLDDVSITAVPEPATWAMMFLGFAMVGGAARYRRRETKVAYA